MLKNIIYRPSLRINTIVLILLVIAIYSIVNIYLKSFESTQSLSYIITFIFGVVITLLLYSLFASAFKMNNSEKYEDGEQNNYSTLQRNDRYSNIYKYLNKTLLHLLNRNKFLRDYGVNIITSGIEEIVTTTNGFRNRGQDKIWANYVYFWEKLIDYQRMGNSLIVRCTHSIPPNVWMGSPKEFQRYSDHILMLQSEFIKNGGGIIRVFIGQEKEPNEDYLTIIEKMKNLGITSKYISKQNISPIHYDFLIVLELNIELKWFIGPTGVNITSSEINDQIDDYDLMMWNSALYTVAESKKDLKSLHNQKK